MNNINIYILIFGVVFIGCSSYNKLDDEKQQTEEVKIAQEMDTISIDLVEVNEDYGDDSDPLIILIFSVFRGESETSDSITLDLSRFTKGNLKRDNTVPANSKIPSGKWKCTFLTAKLNPVNALIIENPLVQVIEHLDQDGEGSNAVEELDKGAFMVRVQDYLDNIKYAFLEKSNEKGEIVIKKYFKLNN